MNTVKEIIGSIKVDAGNLYFIAESGKINGSLLISLEKAIKEYASIREQMAFEAGMREGLNSSDYEPQAYEEYKKEKPLL